MPRAKKTELTPASEEVVAVSAEKTEQERVKVKLKQTKAGVHTVYLPNGFVVFTNSCAEVKKETAEVLSKMGVI